MLYKLSITFLHQNKIILNLVLILHIKVVQLTKQICKKTKKKTNHKNSTIIYTAQNLLA